MWGLPALMFSGLGIFGKMLWDGGGQVALWVFLTLELVNRRYGFAHDEGIFTDRTGGDSWVEIKVDSTEPLGRYLHMLASVIDELRPFIGKRFDFTVSEGRQVEVMLRVSLEVAMEMEEHVKGGREKQALEAYSRLVMTVEPIRLYLEQFPARRKR